MKTQKDHVPYVDGEVYSSAEINLTLEKLCAVGQILCLTATRNENVIKKLNDKNGLVLLMCVCIAS